MKNYKLFSIILSLVIFISTLTLPASGYAATNVIGEANLEEEVEVNEEKQEESDLQIIFENENEKKYKISANDFVYHEKYVNVDGKYIAQITTYSPDEKEIIDYYEQELENISGISLFCGPPCGYIAVITVREIINGVTRYHLKKTTQSATLKVITSAPVTRVQAVVADYMPLNISAGARVFKVRKDDMKHFLVRHHSNYFDASTSKKGNPQSFFVDTVEPRILNHIASQAVHRNISKIISSDSNWVTMDYTYNGIEYRVGVDKYFNAVTQIYPKKTYIKP